MFMRIPSIGQEEQLFGGCTVMSRSSAVCTVADIGRIFSPNAATTRPASFYANFPKYVTNPWQRLKPACQESHSQLRFRVIFPNMALIMPSEAVARRWNGALQARLRRAPLEEFLRVRDLKIAPAGAARDTDNLVRATVFMVDTGVRIYFFAQENALNERQQAQVAQAACMVSHGLAALIGEPGAWRIAALVSAAQLLNPWIGLNAAAYAAAAAARPISEG